MPRRADKIRSWVRRVALSLPLFAVPGPCTTFDDEVARSAPPVVADAGAQDTSAADAPVIGPRAYLSLDDAVRACALVARCPTLPVSIGLSIAVPVAPDQLATCVHFLASPVSPTRLGFARQQGVLQRVAAAKDCKEALAAMPTELLYGADPRCNDAGSAPSSCWDETHVLYCGGDGFGVLYQCGDDRGGDKCLTYSTPDAGTGAACATRTCDAFVPDAFCENGSILRACDPRGSKLETVFDCAWQGLTCALTSPASPDCVGAEDRTPCPRYGFAECSGDRVRFCTSGEPPQWSTFDCAAVGARCEGSGGDTQRPFCIHRSAKCSPLDASVGTCSGTRISLCVDGESVSFDCATVGKTCDPGAKACL